MKFTLQMTMNNTEGVLERVLGRLRQRCLCIHAIDASCNDDLSKMNAKITFETTLTGETILKQIRKLYDVLSITLSTSESNAPIQLSNNNAMVAELVLSEPFRRTK